MPLRSKGASSYSSLQYAAPQTVERKTVASELMLLATFPVQREIIYRYMQMRQMPGAIARGLRISRKTVDAVLMAETRRPA